MSKKLTINFLNKVDMIGVSLMVLVLGCLIWVLKNKYIENFIVLIDEIIIPNECPNYLVTDGMNYYLINSKKVFDGVNNPLKFNSKQDAETYLETNKCPKLDVIDLVVKKDNTDVSVPYERECAKKVAYNIFDEDVCNNYASDEQMYLLQSYTKSLTNLKEQGDLLKTEINTQKLNTGTVNQQKMNQLKQIQEQIQKLQDEYKQNDEALKEFVDYKIEGCMMNTIKDNNQELKDDKFLDNFAKYFNNLNENIGQEFLYI